MNEIRQTKTTNGGQRDMSAGDAPPLMSLVAPEGDDLSELDRDWRPENRAAIDCYNDWIAEHGLPLEELRRF